MQVDRIFVASAVRPTQTKLSLAAPFVIIALFITSTPVLADTLVAGSVYFDSEQTLTEVINLSEQHDNEGIANLIKNGHISEQTQEFAGGAMCGISCLITPTSWACCIS
jgi:hypothetical protein